MHYALNDVGETIPAARGQTATCPGCEETLVGKGGPIVKDYWSHRAGGDCDPWLDVANKMSDFHIGWQELVVRGRREVRIVRDGRWHIADIVAADGQIVEVQHSSISVDKIKEREQFYGNMAWIWDTSEAYAKGNLQLRVADAELPSIFREFEWSRPWWSIGFSEKRSFFDLGNGQLLFVEEIETSKPFAGWGYLVTKTQVIEWINDGPPERSIDPRIALKQKREALEKERKARLKAQAEAERAELEARLKVEAERAAADKARQEAEQAEWLAADEERRAAILAEREAIDAERRRLEAERRKQEADEIRQRRELLAAVRAERERRARICGYWSDGKPCGSNQDVHPYAAGPRCRRHTPAALAGRPEPHVDPELTLEALRRKAGLH